MGKSETGGTDRGHCCGSEQQNPRETGSSLNVDQRRHGSVRLISTLPIVCWRYSLLEVRRRERVSHRRSPLSAGRPDEFQLTRDGNPRSLRE